MAEHRRKPQGNEKGRKEKLVKLFSVLETNYTGNITQNTEFRMR